MSYHEPVGISILTNGNRRRYLESCVSSFIANCLYRPLNIIIYDNGSTNDTAGFKPPHVYGVHWRFERSEVDDGCARGTNASCEMVRDCEYSIHLESDFCHLIPEVSGIDKMWLHRALELMISGECDYLYLRRMADPGEMMAHWWSQWMPKVNKVRGEHMRCPGFWWSNNPALFRNSNIYGCGSLPLDESRDGKKGEPGWSRPELEAPRPTRAWLHRWGVFAHEVGPLWVPEAFGCGRYAPLGQNTCKYGFHINPERFGSWCRHCDHSRGSEDMLAHESRCR